MIEEEAKPFTIKGTPYDIDEVYFEHLMVQLGEFLCERYKKVDIVSPLELLSQVAYINDLTVQQKMFFGLWCGLYMKDMKYEELILQCLNKTLDD